MDLPYAFKAICPTKLFNRVNGPNGKTLQAIESETRTSVHISYGGELFALPSSTQLKLDWKVVTLFADTPETVLLGIERVVDALVECGLKEAEAAVQGEAEYCGKEPGTYLFRVAVPNRSTPAITSRFKEIRQTTGAMVVFDRQLVAAHMQLKLTGTQDGLLAALAIINDCVQTLCLQTWYAGWAKFSSFREHVKCESAEWYKHWTANPEGDGEGQSEWVQGDGSDWDAGETASEDAAHAAYQEDSAKRRRLGDKAEPQLASAASWSEWKDTEETEEEPNEMLEALAWAVHELSEVCEDQLERPFCLTCDIPQKIATEISGPSGKVLDEIMEETDTLIHFASIPEDEEKRQCLIIEGPLLCTFIAHRCLMRRYQIAESKPLTKAKIPVLTMKGKGLVSKGKGKFR